MARGDCLQRHGWSQGGPIILPWTVRGDRFWGGYDRKRYGGGGGGGGGGSKEMRTVMSTYNCSLPPALARHPQQYNMAAQSRTLLDSCGIYTTMSTN